MLGDNDRLTVRGLKSHTLKLLAALPALRQLELPGGAARTPEQAAAVRARLAAAAPHISELTFADEEEDEEAGATEGPDDEGLPQEVLADLMALLHVDAAVAAAALHAVAGDGSGDEEDEDAAGGSF